MRAYILVGVTFLGFCSAAAQEELTELRPLDMGGYAEFGVALAVQGDLAVIGAPGQNARGTESGAAHVLRFAGGTLWEPEALLVAADGAGGDRLGSSVALDGFLALVGAPYHDGSQGAVYVFRRDVAGWVQEAKLSVEGAHGLGKAVALQGDTALVLADHDPSGTTTPAYVFRRAGAAWVQEAALAPPELPGYGPDLWASVALVEDTAFLSYALDSSASPIFVFVRDDAGTPAVQDDAWSPLAELSPHHSGPMLTQPLAARGDRMVAGNPHPSPPSLGRVHVFDREDGGTPGDPLDDVWSQTAELVTPDFGSNFGAQVAVDGDLLLVSDLQGQPAAFLFRLVGATWQVEATMKDFYDGPLGVDTELSAGRAFLSHWGSHQGPLSGAVDVFEQATSWTLKRTLIAPGLTEVGCFGCAVDVSGGPAGAVIVGAQLTDTQGKEAGAAYVFRRKPDGWAQEVQLLPIGLAHGDRFGSSVAVDGTLALVGAHQRDGMFTDQGAAYVFRFDGAAWVQEAELAPPAPSAFGFFGWAVALDGDVALVGAPADDQGGTDAGAVYAFRFDGAAWGLAAELRAEDAAPGDLFGRALALEPGRALIGAPGAGGARGACYVFRDEGAAWTQEARLAAPDGAPLNFFGHACALSGDTALVGAPRALAANMGAAYAFERSPDGTWSLEQELANPFVSGMENDWYGTSVALQGDVALVGAPDGTYVLFSVTPTGKAFELVRTPHAESPWVTSLELAEAVATLPYQKAGFAVALDLDTSVIGAPAALSDATDWDFAGSVFVGALQPPLTAMPPALSTAAGGIQTLELDAPLAEAGRTFLVLGSLAGTVPGLALGPWTLPLNPDAYFLSVLNEPDQPPASGFLGILDELGDGEASVLVPPGLAAGLAGSTAHHAFAVLDFAQGAVTFVSNPAHLALTE
jgi:hypothetical protein